MSPALRPPPSAPSGRPATQPSRSRRALLTGLAAGPLVLAAADRARAAAGPPLLVFGAASLGSALDELVAAWSASGGSRVAVSYAASSALARQLSHGAPADVFISADGEWMAWAARERAVVPESSVELLTNRLVLVAPRSRPFELRLSPQADLAAALGGSRLAIADVAAVPAGRYAKAALESLGLWASVADRLAMAANVRAALALAARGEAAAGIVYRTDARSEPAVAVVDTFAADLHPAIVYPAALTPRGAQRADALAFLAFLKSAAAARVFAAHGFGVAG